MGYEMTSKAFFCMCWLAGVGVSAVIHGNHTDSMIAFCAGVIIYALSNKNNL